MEVVPVADESQRVQVRELRYQVYWEEKHLGFEQVDHDRRAMTDPADERAHLWLAIDDGQPVGTVRVIWGGDSPFGSDVEENFSLQPFVEAVGPERIVIFGRFMVLPEYRSGLASALLLNAIAEFSFGRGVDVGFCDCEPHLVPFYESIGFRPYRSVYNDPVFGLKVPLVLLASDRRHLTSVDSFFLPMIPDSIASTVDPQLAALVRNPSVAGRPSEVVAARFSAAADRSDSFLAELSESDFELLCQKATVVDFEVGDVLIKAGHASRTLWLLLDGVVEVAVDERVVVIKSAGQIVGEFALLLDEPRSAEVRAVSAGRAVALSDRTLQRLMTDAPGLAARFYFGLAGHLARRLHVEAVP